MFSSSWVRSNSGSRLGADDNVAERLGWHQLNGLLEALRALEINEKPELEVKRARKRG